MTGFACVGSIKLLTQTVFTAVERRDFANFGQAGDFSLENILDLASAQAFDGAMFAHHEHNVRCLHCCRDQHEAQAGKMQAEFFH